MLLSCYSKNTEVDVKPKHESDCHMKSEALQSTDELRM